MGVCCGESAKEDVEDNKSRNPMYSRRNVCCTDVLVLILFVAFWGLMIYIAVYSIMRGDARRLLYGYDTFGNTCNQKSNTPITNLSQSGMDTYGKPNVLFMSVEDPLHSMQVCVSQCPDRTMNSWMDVKQFTDATNISLCQYDIKTSEYSAELFSKVGPCPKLPIYKSYSLMHRCIPDPIGILDNEKRLNITNKFIEAFELDDLFREVLSDIYLCYREIIILCGIAVVIGFLMVIMMRFLAFIIVWLIVALAVIGCLVGTAFLWWVYAKEHKENNNKEMHILILNVDIKNEKAFLIFAIIASVLTGILLIILAFMIKRIALVVALFKEAGKCLTALPLLLIQPAWTFIILFAFFFYWVIIMAYIATMDPCNFIVILNMGQICNPYLTLAYLTLKQKRDFFKKCCFCPGTPTANYSKGFLSVEYVPEGLAKHFWWIHLIGLIWTSEFILACQQFVIAGSVAIWYFSRDKSLLCCAICKSISHLILHHIGSVAFGSLIITIVKIPRYILMYIQSKCEASQNACAKCCLRCCICCLYCLEKMLKFLNQNAYTLIAIDGINFCAAAQKAFGILTSNVLRVAAINSVGAFVLFLGKVGVMAATCAIAVVWLKEIPGLHFYAIPVLLISVFSFLIAHCFLSIYEMVVDALLLCFCEDCQMNDGTEGHLYFMNPSLMEFVKDSSAKIEQLNQPRSKRQNDATDGTEMVERTGLQSNAA